MTLSASAEVLSSVAKMGGAARRLLALDAQHPPAVEAPQRAAVERGDRSKWQPIGFQLRRR